MASQRPIQNDLTNKIFSPRSRELTSMLEANHKDFALLVHGAQHNHLPHILSSAYLLGAGPDHLRSTYHNVSLDLETWQPSSHAIKSDEELYAHLGDTRYQRANLEYLQQRLAESDMDWKTLVLEYLATDDALLLGGMVGGFGHPLIQLTDAFELASADLAVEALALAALDYNPLARIVALDQEPQNHKPNASGALATLQKMRDDARLAGKFTSPGVQNTAVILQSASVRSTMLAYFDSLDLSSPTEEDADINLYELTMVAVLLLSTVSRHDGPPNALKKHKFDFYLTHQLTFCWSLRVLAPEFPVSARLRLFRIIWLLMVLTYLHQQLPAIKPDILEQTPLPDAPWPVEWHRLRETALGSTKERGYDPHFVKVLRTLWEFSLLWPQDEATFLKAAIRFESEFDGWTGLGTEGEERMDVNM